MELTPRGMFAPSDPEFMAAVYAHAQEHAPEFYPLIRDHVRIVGDWRTAMNQILARGGIKTDLEFLVHAALYQRASEELLAGN